MVIGRELYSQTYYYNKTTKKVKAKDGGSKDVVDYLNGKGGSRDSTTIDGKEMRAVTGVPDKNSGAPYSYLANESGIIEYNGVVFVCDDLKRQLCLGDMSDPKKVIRIPMTEGGCLMVNRDNLDDLHKAIKMFSPQDINLIMRALRLDAKIQEMEKEIEEMEDGIGKSADEENAADAASAEAASKESKKADGFLGYENEAEDRSHKLTDGQLDMLTQDLAEYLGNKEKLAT